MTKLIGIATHPESKAPIVQHQTIYVSLENGLENDYHGSKKRKNQVTLLSLKSWNKACEIAGTELDWSQRRANLLIDDIDFDESMIGQQIQIGSILLEIKGEADPCDRMEALAPGLKAALTPNWYGGARCKVLREGQINLGDKVSLLKRF